MLWTLFNDPAVRYMFSEQVPSFLFPLLLNCVGFHPTAQVQFLKHFLVSVTSGLLQFAIFIRPNEYKKYNISVYSLIYEDIIWFIP